MLQHCLSVAIRRTSLHFELFCTFQGWFASADVGLLDDMGKLECLKAREGHWEHEITFSTTWSGKCPHLALREEGKCDVVSQFFHWKY